MYQDDATRLRHMRDAALQALGFAKGRARSDLEQGVMLTHALVRTVEIIGEAASKVSPQRRDAHPDIDWQRIIGMRHVLVHDYDKVDLDKLWNVVAKELPSLVEALRAIIGED